MTTGIVGHHEETLVQQKDTRLLKRFLPLIKPHTLMVILSVILMIVLSGLDVAVPWVTRTAVDRYIIPKTDPVSTPGSGHTPRNRIVFSLADPDVKSVVETYPALFEQQQATAEITLENLQRLPGNDLVRLRKQHLSGALLAGFILAALALARFVLSFIQIVVMEYAGQRMMHDLRLTIYSHIQKLPVAFFTQNTVGRLSTRVTNDIQNMQEMFTTIITFVMKDLLTLTGIIIALVSMDMALSAALFIIIPLVILATALFSKQSREVYRVLRVKTAEINSMFSECISGIKVIQLFTHQKKIIDDFITINHENYQAGIRQIFLFGLFMPIIDILGSVAIAIVIFFGGGRVVSDHMSLGTLIAFISYAKMFFRPIRDIAEKHNILQNALSSGERITQILDKDEDTPGGSQTLSHIQSITFAGVDFAYQENEPILKDISFTVNQGEAMAIVGPTGSGKTSLINLIVRFYHRSGGAILINGAPIETVSTRSLRSRIAIVSQDPYLFSGTVRENIVPPGKAMDDQVLETIIRRSHLASVIRNLPDGLDTRISQGGSSLSSGERQLISIARAFAHEPDLIIFDEATSYVDTESEEKIRLAVAQLKENRTSITIAHRLRSAMTADRILVIIDGAITESGNHQSLMDNRQFYYRSILNS